jgi:cupin 2 domain-containing protein
MSAENLFSVTPLPSAGGNADEQFDTLLDQPAFRLERIVSTGQATPVGEWVVLLTGTAAVRFEDEASPRSLQPGDVLHIPPNRRHRVEWTDAASATVWLALHYDEATRDRAAHDRATQRAEGSRL